jgi:transposase
VLKNPGYHFKRIGLEAGPLSQWLYSALAEAGLPVICVETRHMRAVLKAQINKTDRNDARGMAQMMRAGLYRPVHVKTLRSQKLRMLLTHRKHTVKLMPPSYVKAYLKRGKNDANDAAARGLC